MGQKKVGLGEAIHHVASFNLFIEPDGKLHVTVSGGGVAAINYVTETLGLDATGVPADRALKLLKLAEELKA